MSQTKQISRRNFFKTSIGAAGAALVGQTAVAGVTEMCTGESVGPQPLGPFFPRPGTPAEPIREDRNPQTPIYLANDADLTKIKGKNGRAEGQVVYIQGQVTDSDCKPVVNATIIIWQASHHGRYNHVGDADNTSFTHPKTGQTIERHLDEHFQYWGKARTDANGHYEFKTVVPGFYPADLENAWYRPPHIHFMVSATGFPQVVTQMYFRGEGLSENSWIQELNQRDALLQSRSLTETQRENLIVDFAPDPAGVRQDGLVGQFNIVLTR